MRIVCVPQLEDNYGWLLVEEGGARAVIVDPAEAEPVLAAAQRERVELVGVLATHHHADHVGGIPALLAQRPGLEVLGYGPDRARIPGLTRALADGERTRLLGTEVLVRAVPCHTRGHVAYLAGGALFAGDTLFAGGCGRFFEGEAADMYRALHLVIGVLPDDTLLYCGHEYTEANLRFAATLEPGNTALATKREAVRTARAAGRATVPTTLGEERSYNPFLRVTSPELCRAVAEQLPAVDTADPVAVLGAVRALKDRFRG